MKLKSILAVTGLALVLAMPAFTRSLAAANPDNNGNHHCGGNNGQGVGNYCKPQTGGTGSTGSSASGGTTGATSPSATSSGSSVGALGAGGTKSTATTSAKAAQHREFCRDHRHDEWRHDEWDHNRLRHEYWRPVEQGRRTVPGTPAAAAAPAATTHAPLPQDSVIGVDISCPKAAIGYNAAPRTCGSTIYSLKPGETLTPEAVQCIQSEPVFKDPNVSTACTLQRFYTCPVGQPATACYTVNL